MHDSRTRSRAELSVEPPEDMVAPATPPAPSIGYLHLSMFPFSFGRRKCILDAHTPGDAP